MTLEPKSDDLRAWRLMNLSLLQWLAILAILGLAVSWLGMFW